MFSDVSCSDDKVSVAPTNDQELVPVTGFTRNSKDRQESRGENMQHLNPGWPLAHPTVLNQCRDLFLSFANFKIANSLADISLLFILVQNITYSKRNIFYVL